MTREELYKRLDNFLDCLLSQNPSRVTWHGQLLYTENNVALEPGDGLWNTITGLGDYDFRFADVQTGQVGLFTTVIETEDESACTIRLGFKAQAIFEVEILVVRAKDEALKFPNPKFYPKPVNALCIPIQSQDNREELIACANGYFETLELNDGEIHTQFAPDCNRVENGTQTTNNPDFFVPIAHLGCEEQFKLGYYRYDDRLRGRRFPLVDQETGIVLAGGFIDHKGALGSYELTDGRVVQSPIRRPHTFYLMEAFKIIDQTIVQIEANFITVPYHMKSPWDETL